MTRLTVEIDDFVAAARAMHDDVGEPVRHANARLVNTLAGCGSMAGDDDGGRTWATAYDDAAESVLIATSRVAAAAFQTATLFGHSATNYAKAEAASTTSGPGSPAHLVQGLPPTGTVGRVAAPPSAAGGGGDEPSGWGLIKSLVGYVWPNGHQDRLRRSANAYRHCANVLESVAIEPAAVSIRFLCDRLPEADDVNIVCGGLAERIRSLGDAHRTLARSCEELADHIDHCHSEIESELSSLAIESGALQVAGAIASVFTLGGAEVPTQVAQAARIAAVAAKVAEIIRRFIAAARVLDAAIPPVAHAALSITQALDKLANARAATANVTTVPRLDRQNMMAGRGETAATGRLARDASTPAVRSDVATRVSPQRQARHVRGSPLYRGGGYFTQSADAQRVLDAFHRGEVEIIRLTKAGHILVRCPSVTGFNVNPTAGHLHQPTSVFMIKGTRSVSVVPYSPAG